MPPDRILRSGTSPGTGAAQNVKSSQKTAPPVDRRTLPVSTLTIVGQLSPARFDPSPTISYIRIAEILARQAAPALRRPGAFARQTPRQTQRIAPQRLAEFAAGALAPEPNMVTAADPSIASPLGDLTLRYCGDDRPELRLHSRKCTIGSGAHCTLRLRAPAVEPVHCLIVRGAQRTIVRSCSQTTRFNGRAFHDAALSVGDRLSFGPWEFEVVDLGYDVAKVTDQESNLAQIGHDAADLERQRNTLESQQRLVSAQAASVENELFELHRQFERLRSDRERLEADQAAWQAEAAQRGQAAADLQAPSEPLRQELVRLQTLVESLECERQRYETQQARDSEAGFGDDAPSREAVDRGCESPTQVNQTSEELDRQAAILLEQVQLFERQRSSWEQQCQAVRGEHELAQRRLQERAEELDRHAEELREQQATLDARERAVRDSVTVESPPVAAERQPEAGDEEAAAQTSELQARLNAELQAVEDSRRQTQALLAEELSRISGRERELLALTAELNERQAELDRREAAEGDQNNQPLPAGEETAEDATRLAERTLLLDQRDLELEALRQQLEEQQRQSEAQAEQLKKERSQLVKQTLKFQQAQAELEAEAAAVKRQREELEEHMRRSREAQPLEHAVAGQLSGDGQASRDDDLPSLLSHEPADGDSSNELDHAEPSADGRLLAMFSSDASQERASIDVDDEAAAPVVAEVQEEKQEDLRDLLRRMGALPKDEEPTTATMQPPSTIARAATTHSARSAAKAPPQPHEDREEDHDAAVQAYMARLLGHNSAASMAVPSSATNQTSATPAPATPGSSKRPSTRPELPPQPVREYTRVAAPEKQADLNAFREVANQSAEAALGKFRRRKAMFGIGETLFLATSAGVGANFILIYDPFGPALSIYAAVACVFLMIVMLVRTMVAVRLLKNLNAKQAPPSVPKLAETVTEQAASPAGAEQAPLSSAADLADSQ